MQRYFLSAQPNLTDQVHKAHVYNFALFVPKQILWRKASLFHCRYDGERIEQTHTHTHMQPGTHSRKFATLSQCPPLFQKLWSEHCERWKIMKWRNSHADETFSVPPLFNYSFQSVDSEDLLSTCAVFPSSVFVSFWRGCWPHPQHAIWLRRLLRHFAERCLRRRCFGAVALKA